MSATAPLRGAVEAAASVVPGSSERVVRGSGASHSSASRRRPPRLRGAALSFEGWASILLRDPGEEETVVPRLRGVSHALAFWLALIAALVLVIVAPGPGRAPALVYGVGLCALFAISGLYHRWRWDRRWRPLLRRLDHSTIYVFIAASCTPLGLLLLSGPMRTIVVLGVWFSASGGVVLSVAWIAAPRVLVAVSYLAVGCVAIAAVPQLLDRLGAAPIVLLGLGALLYCLGAGVYAFKRPDPWPSTFGFHEVFHSLVILAAASHFVAIAGWIIPNAA
jgi:hemolysin III